MGIITFETLTFHTPNKISQDHLNSSQPTANDSVDYITVDLLRSYSLQIPKEELEAIAPFEMRNPHQIEFKGINQQKAKIKFFFVLNKYLSGLKTKLTGNSATYIHRHSGIPLIGNVAFGLVYRNSSLIEIKTNNGCNLNCVYCSIAEGLSSKKHDFVIEKDYLLEELQKLLAFVDEPVEIHIGVQGEPFLYGDMENLIEDLQGMELVHTISLDTNGTLLSKAMVDRLAGCSNSSRCSKLQLNFSLDALDEERAKSIAGVKNYNVQQIKKIISYASQKLKVLIAPVLTSGLNEQEIEKIILFAKSLPDPTRLGIQNFLNYKTGRNPAKEISWEEFYALLEKLERKHDFKLRLSKEDFNIREMKELPKPFKTGDIVSAVIKCPDRFPNSVIAAAKGRTISVSECSFVKDKKIKVKILRDKHNIFVGKII